MFTSLFNQMDGLIESQVLGGYGAVVGMVRGPLAAGIGVYFAVAGYAVLRGIAGEGWGHLLNQGFKASLVFAAVTSGIGGVTARSVMELPTELAVAGAGGSVGGQLDAFVNNVRLKSDTIVNEAPQWDSLVYEGPDPTLVMLAWIPKLTALGLAALMLVYLVFLKFALAVAALFGPIFVAMLLFDSTRGMFFTWLGAVLGYALSSVVIGLTIAFIFATAVATADSLLVAIASSGGAAAATDAAAAALLGETGVLLVGLLFLMQAQGIAQGLAGGGGGSGALVAGAVVPAVVGLAKSTSGTVAGRFNRPPGQVGAGPGAGPGVDASKSGKGSLAFRGGHAAARISQEAMRRVMGK